MTGNGRTFKAANR